MAWSFSFETLHIIGDRLHWAPAPTAKSALRVAAHTALYACRFAKMIRDRRHPALGNVDAWLAKQAAEEEAVIAEKK